jgi:hypothetical protein
MPTHALILNPTRFGRKIHLTDGRQLARFRAPGALGRARRYITQLNAIAER